MDTTLTYYSELITDYVKNYANQMLCEPAGKLAHPFIVPGSKFYSTNLWDWDSWMTDIALRQYASQDKDFAEKLSYYELGCLMNFADYTTEEGFMPICVTPEGASFDRPEGDHWPNMHKPVYAQHAAFLASQGIELPDKVLDAAVAFLTAYENHFKHEKSGLFFWQDDCAIGVDNDPCTYFRPAKSSGSILLNSFIYREMLALGTLYEQKGDMTSGMYWKKKAGKLAAAVSKHCFDERDGCFYSVDLNLLPNENIVGLHSGAPRDWETLIMRIDVWSNILPLWAGIATAEQAEAVMQRFRETRTYKAAYGIRSLSAKEKMYDLSATNNPSNWRGPIWGVASYFCWRAMVKYGFIEDATWLAEATIRLFGQDLAKTGTLHEYYNPDTGEAIITPNFINWNALVLNMIAWLKGEPCCFEF